MSIINEAKKGNSELGTVKSKLSRAREKLYEF